jgi:acetylornithine deacetylase/succinyl-diaminopimelate desuccinylase-like protein
MGIRQMSPHLPALLGKPRLCVVGEPTNMGAAIGHKCKVVWQTNCQGQTGHSAMAPNYCNALHLATDLVTIIQKYLQALTSNQRVFKVDYGTEAGFSAAMGIPTLVCGPGNMAQGHQPDEFIESDELAACSQFLYQMTNQDLAG